MTEETESKGKRAGNPSADPGTSKKPVLEKATFYLEKDLLDRIDILWLNLRRENPRKIKKSDVVKDLLERGLEAYAGKG
jgi:hypothetical protein